MKKFIIIAVILVLFIIDESFGQKKKKKQTTGPCDFRCSKKNTAVKDRNGIIYKNRCEIKKARCLENSCRALNVKRCPHDAQLVCASDNHTYKDACAFCAEKKKLHKQGIKLFFLHHGECATMK